MKWFIKALIALTILGGLYLWSIWPMTTIMSKEGVIWRLNAAVPEKAPVGDWQERGKYLLTVAGCGMCHTPYSWIGPHGGEAFEGGMRVRWNNGLKDRVAFNLTPDKDTGMGLWSEEDFIIGMKSGLYPNGDVAHWQAMPWDMHSNWSLDDMRAMYSYLMSLEPQTQKKPNPINKPLPEDDTFYFGT
ncbi:MAG: hypothetical protein ACI9CF_001221 [Candidatus Omnitrophota bacterium]